MKSELTKKQKPKTKEEAIRMLRQLLEMATYQDIDSTDKKGAEKLLARWFVAESCLQKLEEK